MPQLLWDASSLVKRYFGEVGSGTVNALFAVSPVLPMATTFMGYAETCAILRRKRNQGAITASAFSSARRLLDTEVFYGVSFDLLSIEDAAILSGIALADAHNINSTDAAILATYLDYTRSLLPTDPRCVLVASDLRLLRAATAEGLKTFNPETILPTDVPGFIASL